MSIASETVTAPHHDPRRIREHQPGEYGHFVTKPVTTLQVERASFGEGRVFVAIDKQYKTYQKHFPATGMGSTSPGTRDGGIEVGCFLRSIILDTK